MGALKTKSNTPITLMVTICLICRVWGVVHGDVALDHFSLAFVGFKSTIRTCHRKPQTP